MNTPTTLSRKEAIELLAKKELSLLTFVERENHLLVWWDIDENDLEFNLLPDSLRTEMREYETFEDLGDPKYDPLLLQALMNQYKGVRNEYVERQLKSLNELDVKVEGEIEHFEKCPVCEYRTFEVREERYICVVCFWEDDVIQKPKYFSRANKMTLRDAKINFQAFGACKKKMVMHAEKEPDLKYEK